MASFIDWYLVELKLRLDRKLPAERVSTILKETESHLRESVSLRSCSSDSIQSSEAEAIEAYGLPEKVAEAYLRRKLFGLNPVWTALAASVIAIYCWNFHWLTLGGYFDNFGETWQNALAGLIGFIALILIAIASRKAIRSHRLPIAALSLFVAAASIPVMSIWMISTQVKQPLMEGLSRFHLNRDLKVVRTSLGRLQAYKTFLLRGEQAYAHASDSQELPLDLRNANIAANEFGADHYNAAAVGTKLFHRGQFVVPRDYGVMALTDGRIYVLETMQNFRDAKTAWAKETGRDLKGIGANEHYCEFLLNAAYQAKNGRLFFPNPELYEQTVYGTIMLIPLLLLFDLFGIIRLRRRIPLERVLT